MWLKSSSLLALTLALSTAYADDQPAPAMDGVWIPVAGEAGGQPFPEEFLKTFTLTIKGEAYFVVVNGEEDRGTVKLIPDTNPKAIDITGTEGPNKGKTIPAIYELEGDTFRVCYDLGGETRPTEFKTVQGTMQLLITYKREPAK